jgi:recombination protein RecA
MSTIKDKLKLARSAMQDIEKQFGRGAIMLLGGEDSRIEPVQTTPTGSVGLDLALGVGGLPRGRIVEIFGPEASGKTTLALHAIAAVQRQGGIAAFIDAEHALDPRYAQALGIQLDQLLVSQPDSGEQALEITETLLRSSAVDLVVVDSVAALVPKAELEGEMGDSHVGLQARLMSSGACASSRVMCRAPQSTIIFINQIRQKIGVTFGNARDHHRRQRAQVLRLGAARCPRRIGTLKDGEDGLRKPRARARGEEQARPAVPRDGVRRALRGTPWETCVWAKVARRRASGWRSAPTS